MNAIVPTVSGSNALIPTDMDQAIRLAQAMASAKLVPEHLQGDTGSCLMIVEQAMRWGMSPFAVAQCTSVIYGRLMHEGKLVAAAVQASGALSSRFRYEYSGEGDNREVTVIARIHGEESDRTIKIVLKDVRTTDKNGKVNKQWTGGQVDQQLSYAGVRAWARRHTPEVLLGVYSPEEFDAPKQDSFKGTTIDGDPVSASRRDEINAETPMRPAAAASVQRPPRKAEPAATTSNGKQRPSDKSWVDDACDRLWVVHQNGTAWAKLLLTLLSEAPTEKDVLQLADVKSIQDATNAAPPSVKRELTAGFADAIERFRGDAAEPEPIDNATPEQLADVEIEGAKYAGA